MKRWLLKLGFILLALTLITVSYAPIYVQASNEFISIDVSAKNVIKGNEPRSEPRSQAISVSSQGTLSSKSEGSAKSMTCTWNVGDFAVLVFAGDTAASTDTTYTAIRGGGSGGSDLALTQDVIGNNAGNVVLSILSAKILTATSSVLNTSAGTGSINAFAFTWYKVTGLADSPKDTFNSGTGSGTDATTGSTGTLAQADEIIFAASGVEDEVDDGHGTWTTGATYISGNEQFDATNDGGDSSNIQVHSVAEIVSATTAQSGADTGHDSNDWAACIVSYKMDTGATYDFTLNQSSKALGTVTVSTTYWTNGSAPTGNLDDAEAYFTITSTGTAACDIDFHGHNATGGVGATLTSSSPGANEYRVKIYKEGDAVPAGGAYLTTSDNEIVSNLAASGNIDWEASVEMGSSFGDGVAKSAIITLTSRAVS